ncbi:MAG: SGNH/GDSL hydrolase family protein [Burkholderiaceae bacterium]|nr:SGNH/GDSL hydrolase family protein [Burkholderiaceae bacterium]
MKSTLLRRHALVLSAAYGLAFACAAQGLSSLPTADSGDRWIGTWAAAPQPAFPGPPERLDDRTLRLVVHVSAGGERVRIRISNTYGRVPLHIAAAHVARRRSGAEIDAASDRALSFGGRPGVVVAPGDTVLSDPVALTVPALSDLAVSLQASGRVEASTTHALAQQTSYVSLARGNATGAAQLPQSKAIDSWPFLTGVEAEAAPGGAAIVMFGDSWVDGDGSTPDANARWPDALAAHLQAAGGACAHLAVLNEGLIGNRLLHDSPVVHAPRAPDFGRALGESGLARFDRDVTRQAGARAVILHLGNNDLGFEGGVAPAGETVSVTMLLAGYRELIARAHRAGLLAVGTTLTPVAGTKVLPNYDTPDKEQRRQQVNAWIRDSGEFDAVIDVDSVVRDAAYPAQLATAIASQDRLHPNDAGYAAVAEAVPTSMCADISSTRR